MNGRAFDYNLGRFLSVDPFIQAPDNSQSFNPYSYIMNNPLAGTDPSGYSARVENEKVITLTTTGSRIKKKVKVSGVENSEGGLTFTVSGNSGADVKQVAGQVATALNAEGMSVSRSDIGSRPSINTQGEPTNGASSSAYNNSTNQSGGDFWKAVGSELWNNAGDYGKQVVSGAINMLVDNAPDAFKDVTGYTSATEMLSAIENGDLSGVGWAAVGFGLSKVPGAKGLSGKIDDFFEGAQYTPKVELQMKKGDFHAFPESVKGFQGLGNIRVGMGR